MSIAEDKSFVEISGEKKGQSIDLKYLKEMRFLNTQKYADTFAFYGVNLYLIF